MGLRGGSGSQGMTSGLLGHPEKREFTQRSPAAEEGLPEGQGMVGSGHSLTGAGLLLPRRQLTAALTLVAWGRRDRLWGLAMIVGLRLYRAQHLLSLSIPHLYSKEHPYISVLG